MHRSDASPSPSVADAGPGDPHVPPWPTPRNRPIPPALRPTEVMATAVAPPPTLGPPARPVRRPARPPERRPRRSSVIDGLPAGASVVVDALAVAGLGLVAVVGLALLGLLLHHVTGVGR